MREPERERIKWRKIDKGEGVRKREGESKRNKPCDALCVAKKRAKK